MKKTLRLLPLAALFYALSQQVAATLDIRFVESAPKDWFSVTNQSQCVLKEFTITIDMSDSAGRLIFDTTASGAGVQVFQPFEVRKGEVELVSSAEVKDGANTLSVMVRNLKPDDSASFTIDVDDTLPRSELGMIRVSGAEITGSMVSFAIPGGPPAVGIFDKNGKIELPSPQCP